jgi:hypothetical protein
MMTHNTNKLVDRMVAAGTPATHAVAIATAIEHALVDETYASQYGTFMVDALREMVTLATADEVPK